MLSTLTLIALSIGQKEWYKSGSRLGRLGKAGKARLWAIERL